MNRYVVGSTPTLRAAFTAEDGQPADPTPPSPYLRITDPNGVLTTYDASQLVHDDLGKWSKPLTVAIAGTWSYTWDGDGAVEAEGGSSFYVSTLPVLAVQGPCQAWAEVADVCGDVTGIDPTVLELWLRVATNNLYNITGRQWPGECMDIWYPGGGECAPLAARGRPLPSADRRLMLPGYPVVSVQQVVIDGVALPSTEYRIEDQRYLVRLDSDGKRISWPRAEGWSVEYSYGHLPPPGGRESAAALGHQYAVACTGVGGECRLPKRVQTITRQGVTMAVLDPLTLLDKGKTGLEEVDAWLAAMKLGAARRPGAVWIPGSRPAGHRRTTGHVPVPPAVPSTYGGGY